MTLRIDPSEPCAECGIALGDHPRRGEMAIASRADREDHVWSAFNSPPIPFVKGGEFLVPPTIDGLLPVEWKLRAEAAEIRERALRAVLGEAERLVSIVHDRIYEEPFDQKAASDAVWAVHEVIRPSLPEYIAEKQRADAPHD